MATPTSILYCIDRLPANGGTEKQLIGLIERLDRRRCSVHLCTLARSQEQPELPDCAHFPLNVSKLARPSILREITRLAAYMRSVRVEVVHAFFQDAVVVAGLASWAAGVPVRLRGLRDLGFWRRGVNQMPLRLANRLFTGFVANSGAVRDHYCAADGLPRERVAVIPNGVAPEDFPFTGHEGAASTVGLVANLDRPVKRVDLFLRAAALLCRERPELTWHIIGTGTSLTAFRSLARELGIAERVVFAGAVHDVNGYLGRIEIGVNCSDSEGFSNSLLEYMLRGCAVVATDVGGNREVIRSNENGLLVQPGDPAALAAAIGRLAVDPSRRAALAREARRNALLYDWKRCVEAHHELYARSLTGASAKPHRRDRGLG